MFENVVSGTLLTSKLAGFLGEPSLQLELSNQWRMTSAAGFRGEIRAALKRRLLEQGYSLNQTILDLAQVPSSEQVSISISHCPLLGGFALVRKPIQVGLDVEQRDRIKPRIVKRVSTAEEVSNAPFLDFLWVAKESVFKACLGICQPAVISDIRVFDWDLVQTSQIVTFRAAIEQDSLFLIRSRGVILYDKDALLGLFLIPPQTLV